VSIEKEIETGGFKYQIRLVKKDDGVVFDIFDTVCMAGEFEPDIIGSGKIDEQGRCRIENIYCDAHAAKALGHILENVYEGMYEMMGP
jgi:hypothetical protein